MTQISRPFQIALAAVVVIALVWFVALRGHSSSSSESSSPAASTGASPATKGSGSGSSSSAGSSGASSPSSPTYHGSAPGVAGLTRAIAKARGAAAQSEQNAKQLAQKEQQAASSAGSSQTSSTSASASSGAGTGTHPSSARSHSTSAAAGKAKTAPTAVAKPAPRPAAKARPGAAAATKAKAGLPAGQLAVEAQLKQGKDVAILLWNPKGSVDAVVRRELHSASRTFSGKLAVHVAVAAQVGSFGTFTRAVQVYSTPTILLIEPKGVTSSVTGLTDAFSIEQAVRELRQPK